jgi:hypothetical protein
MPNFSIYFAFWLPIVAKCDVVKLFSQNLSNRQVFPTPESPIMRSLAIKSYPLEPFDMGFFKFSINISICMMFSYK